MLYIYEHTDKENESFVTEALPYLSEQRRYAVMRCRKTIDRVNGCAVYLMLRYALFKEYGIKDAPVFGFIENEKPYLPTYPQIHFSFSHCRNAAACIVSDNNTAVDIMDIRKKSAAVINRVCSENELNILSSSDEREFIRLWTRKECLSKLTGKGMQSDFRTLTDELPEMKSVITIDRGEHIVSYCSPDGETSLSLVKKEELFEVLSYVREKSIEL